MDKDLCCLCCMVSLAYHSAKCSCHMARCVSACKWHFCKKHVGEQRSFHPAAPQVVLHSGIWFARSWVSLVLSFSSEKIELSIMASNKGKAEPPTVCLTLLRVKFVGGFAGFLLYTSAYICSKHTPGCEKICKQNSASRYTSGVKFGVLIALRLTGCLLI